jgi:hypothetical protein
MTTAVMLTASSASPSPPFLPMTIPTVRAHVNNSGATKPLALEKYDLQSLNGRLLLGITAVEEGYNVRRTVSELARLQASTP